MRICECGNISENKETGECASCGSARRKAERLSRKATIVNPVKKITAKRAAENIEYLKLKREYLIVYPVCEVEECHLKSVDVHHQGGKENGRLLDINFFMAVCRQHHDYYTEHSREAIEKGYSVLRTSKDKTI